MTIKEQIEGILLNDFGSFDDYSVEKLLNLHSVSKRSLADIEIEYKHPTGKKKGKLKYDDDKETLILDCKGGFITLPNIEDCNVC